MAENESTTTANGGRVGPGGLLGWRKNANELLESVMHLANDAREIGEPGQSHGRLLYRAHDFVLEVQDDLYVVGTTPGGILDQLWDLQAYFSGVAEMTAAPAGVRALAQKAWDMIEASSDQFDTLDYGDSAPENQPPAAAPSAAPAASETDRGPSTQPSGDLSPAQVQSVLEAIATTANVLRGFAYSACQNPNGDDTYMMAMMVERIGQLADFAGAGCVGGPAEWMLGPNFKGEGVSRG